jgi:hypothetical protein
LDKGSARRKGLYRHTTTQHINTRENIHAPGEIHARDPGNKAAETYALDRAATVIVIIHVHHFYKNISTKLKQSAFLLVLTLRSFCISARIAIQLDY